MLRLTPHRTAFRLQLSSGTRGYAAPSATGAVTQPPKGNDYRPAKAVKVGEDSLAGKLYKETDAGKSAYADMQARLSKAAAKRRAARLAREAEAANAGESTPPSSTRQGDAEGQLRFRPRDYRVRLGQKSPNVDLDIITSSAGQQQQRPLRRRPRVEGSERQGDRRPQRQDNQRNGRAPSKPQPRKLAYNKPPAPRAAVAETTSEQEEAELIANVEQPNAPGPLPVLREFTSLLPASKDALLDKALKKVPGQGSVPDPYFAGHILRKFGGDYASTIAAPSPANYTTRVDKLPVLTQLALASAKNRSIDQNARKLLAATVAKSVGSIASAA